MLKVVDPFPPPNVSPITANRELYLVRETAEPSSAKYPNGSSLSLSQYPEIEVPTGNPSPGTVLSILVLTDPSYVRQTAPSDDFKSCVIPLLGIVNSLPQLATSGSPTLKVV
jgi:hypothetical protein